MVFCRRVFWTKASISSIPEPSKTCHDRIDSSGQIVGFETLTHVHTNGRSKKKLIEAKSAGRSIEKQRNFLRRSKSRLTQFITRNAAYRVRYSADLGRVIALCAKLFCTRFLSAAASAAETVITQLKCCKITIRGRSRRSDFSPVLQFENLPPRFSP